MRKDQFIKFWISSGTDWNAYCLQQIAIFKATLVSNSIWDKLDLINLGFSGASAYLNLKTDAVVASLANATSFLEDKVGFFGNAAAGRIDYTYNPSTGGNVYSLNSAYFAIYQWLASCESGIIAGCNDSTGYLSLNVLRNTNQLRYAINMGSSTKNLSYTGASDGYISLSKSGNNVTVARNGVGINTSAITTTAVPNKTLTGLVNNTPTGYFNYSYNKLGAVIAGSYLTQAEDLILYTALDLLISKIADSTQVYDSGSLRYTLKGFSNKSIKGVEGDYRFAISSGYIWYSSDAGVNWTSKAFTNALYIDFVKFWDTGTVTFSCYNKIYRSADALTTVTEITTQLPDTSPYTIHTPVNASYPGDYYRIIGDTKKMYRSSAEIFIWGGYTNYSRGAAPVNIYEASNDGQVITVIYQFGQNPFYKDDGTDDGGTTGNLLGDATNPTYVRHVHSVCWDEANSTVYFCTGDSDRAGPVYECLWGKLVYVAGVYTPTIIVSGTSVGNYKSCGLVYKDGYIYYVCDSLIYGVWKTTPANIATVGNHIQLLVTTNYLTGMINDSDNLLVNEFSGANKLHLSKDMGANWESINLEYVPGYPTNANYQPIGYKDSDDYVWYNPNYISEPSNFRIKAKII